MGEIKTSKSRIDAGEVVTIVLSQPSRKNALSQAMWAELADVATQLRAADALAVVVRGDGPAFCAGADISEFAEVYGSPEAATTSSATIARALDAVDALPMPTIAVIEGPCMGGGCALALACDLQLCASSARFGVDPTALGTAYSLRDCQRLVARIGISRTKRLLMAAERIAASTAEQWGMVTQVVEPNELDSALKEILGGFATRSPDALARVKATLAAIESSIGDNSPELDALFQGAFNSADFAEGTAAFLSKRTPSFPGRHSEHTA